MANTRCWIALALTALLGLLAACSHRQASGKQNSTGAAKQSGQSSGSRLPPALAETEIKRGEAPAGGYSCRYYDPAERALYFPSKHYLEFTDDSREMGRRSFELLMHGLVHAKQWEAMIEQVEQDSAMSGAARTDVVRTLQMQRMKKAGSPEAFVQKRLGEEFRAKQRAWRTANEVGKYGQEPPEEGNLTADEKRYYREQTLRQIRQIREDVGDPFES